MSAIEQRGYAKGYAAATRRYKREVAGLQRQVKMDDKLRYDQFFCAALQGLLAGSPTWTIGKKKVKDQGDYVKLARGFAKESLRQLR